MTKVKLICIPFAGGSKYAYQSFNKFCPQTIELITLELPGRGARHGERRLTDIASMVRDIFTQIKPYLSARDNAIGIGNSYVLYGHSMGALLVYELIKFIRAENLQLPMALFLTGHGAPGTRIETSRHLLSKDEFINEIRSLGGSPEEVLQDETLMLFFEPILRADFEAIETYEYEECEKFDIPITVVIGSHEETTQKEAKEWKEISDNEFELLELPGKHFFIFEHAEKLMQLIVKKIHQYGRTIVLP